MWYVGTQAPSLGWQHRLRHLGGRRHWTRYWKNPVLARQAGDWLFASPVLAREPTYHMWYYQWNGVFDRVSYADSTCCDPGLFADDFESGDTSAWSVTVP